jgi:hypothetical protein
MNPDPVTYLSTAIARAEGGLVASVSGSHLGGVFSRCAKDFEKEIRVFVVRLLDSCKLDYERDLRALPRRNFPILEKATLGNLVAIVRDAERLQPTVVSRCTPRMSFIEDLRKINDAWVKVKHSDDVISPVLVARMKDMLVITMAIRSLANR